MTPLAPAGSAALPLTLAAFAPPTPLLRAPAAARAPEPALHSTLPEGSVRRSRPLRVTSIRWRRSWERSAVTNGTGPE
jgi:hypothetical protein